MSDTPPPELVDRLARIGLHAPLRRCVLAALAEWADGALIDPKTWTLWDAEYEDIGPSLALVLSPREGER